MGFQCQLVLPVRTVSSPNNSCGHDEDEILVKAMTNTNKPNPTNIFDFQYLWLTDQLLSAFIEP